MVNMYRNPPSQKGLKRSDETKQRLRNSKLGKYDGVKNPFYGRKHSPETRKKLSESHRLSYIKNPELRKIIGQKSKGRKFTSETKLKMSKKHRKEKHWNWKGGISENPYPKFFSKELKLKIRERDNFKCCLCYKTEREELEELNRVLCVNHIDFNKENCKEENLNTLCLRCNVKINRERDYWTNYFKNNE